MNSAAAVVVISATPVEVFTFIDGETKQNVHLDIEAMRVWCAEHHEEIEKAMAPVEEQIAASFYEVDNSINIENVKRIAKLPKLDPLILCKTGGVSNGAPDVILADGHHRYFLAAIQEVRAVPAYLLEPVQWKQFEVALPDMTEEELRAMPPKALPTITKGE